MVKRYCLQVDSETESPYGPWLKASDYDALQAKHDNLAWNLDGCMESINNLSAQKDALAAELAASRMATETNFNLYRAGADRISALEAQDEVHWKTRRSLLAELERCRAANVYDGNAHRKVAEFEAALQRIAAYSAGLTPIPGDPIEIARTAFLETSEEVAARASYLKTRDCEHDWAMTGIGWERCSKCNAGRLVETFAEPAPAKVHYSADDYEGLAVALADLLKQVNKFCEESGEGDFYTGCALAALGMSDNEVHVKTLNDLRSQANRSVEQGRK